MYIILCDHDRNRSNLSDSSTPDNSKLKQPWYRRKKSLLVIGAILAFSTVSIAVAVSLKLQEQTLANAVRFACGTSSSNPAFNVTAGIDLSDGMNRQEALIVADTVYARVSGTRRQNVPSSLEFDATANDNGVWTVKFQAVYTITSYFEPGHSGEGTRVVRENFAAIINPFDLTVTYSY